MLKKMLKEEQTTKMKNPQVFVAEGEPAMFECRVEPKHDLNLSVRWYRNDEELVGFWNQSSGSTSMVQEIKYIIV